jgi:hypothetical protein
VNAFNDSLQLRVHVRTLGRLSAPRYHTGDDVSELSVSFSRNHCYHQ